MLISQPRMKLVLTCLTCISFTIYIIANLSRRVPQVLLRPEEVVVTIATNSSPNPTLIRESGNIYTTTALTTMSVQLSPEKDSYEVMNVTDKDSYEVMNVTDKDSYEVMNVTDKALYEVMNVTDKDSYEVMNVTEEVEPDLADYRQNYYEIEKAVNDRVLKVKDVCNSIGNKYFHRPMLFHFEKLNISWCPSYKAGSTVWKNFFVQSIFGDHITRPKLDMLWSFRVNGFRGRDERGRRLYTTETPGAIRFTVVRHPVVRLISFWKMSKECWEISRTSSLRDVILQRKLTNPLNLTNFTQQFDDYLKWCENQTTLMMKGDRYEKADQYKMAAGSEDNPFMNPPYMLFSEFIDHIKEQRERLGTQDWEGHWAPASEWCDMCVNDYDYIIKLENEPNELYFLLEKLNLLDRRSYFLSLSNNSTSKPSQHTEIREYAKLLTPDQKEFINDFFINDLHMFSYDEIL